MIKLMIQHVCPALAMTVSGGYEVQPAAAAPPSRKKPSIMMIPAMGKKFPNVPTRRGMITKKIITVPCMVNKMAYLSPGTGPIKGTGSVGQAMRQRTAMARSPPSIMKKMLVKRN